MNDTTERSPSAAEVTDLRDALFWSAVALTAKSSDYDYQHDGVRPGHEAWVEGKLREDIHYQLKLAPGLFEALIKASRFEDERVCRLLRTRAKTPYDSIQLERERVYTDLPPRIWSEGVDFPGVAPHVAPLAVSRPTGWRPGWPPGASGVVPPLPAPRSYEAGLADNIGESQAASPRLNESSSDRKLRLLESVSQTPRSAPPPIEPLQWLAQFVKRLWSRGPWG